MENDDRARRVAERLAELSRRRERGLITEWEYHEASRLVLEGADDAPPGDVSDYPPLPGPVRIARAHRRAPARWVRLATTIVVLGALAAATWFFLLRDGDAAGTQAVTTTSAAGPSTSGTSVPPTTVPDGDDPPATTTTIPSQLLEVGEAVLGHRSTAAALRADAEAASGLWEEREATYAATLDEFTRIAAEAQALVEDAAAVAAPTGFVRDYQLTVTVLEEFAEAAAGLVTGLEASDDGSRRRAALESLVVADRAHDAAVTALLTLLGIDEPPQPAL